MYVYVYIYIEREIKKKAGGCFHGVMVKTLDCRTVVSEFKLQSSCYVHFWTNTLRKGMNPLILLAMGFIVPLIFLKNAFVIK